MSQVSCEVTVPRDSRPNEGIIVINIELSPMAAPHFEAGRRSDKVVRCLMFSAHYVTECVLLNNITVNGIKFLTFLCQVH